MSPRMEFLWILLLILAVIVAVIYNRDSGWEVQQGNMLGILSVGSVGPHGIRRPPEQYRGEYTGHLFIAEFDVWAIEPFCEARGVDVHASNGRVWGCSMVYPMGLFGGDETHSCVVIIPTAESTSQAVRDAMLEHEIGHCNGWPADHSRGEG